MKKFIVIVESLAAIASSGNIVTKNGEKLLVINDPENWVEATSRSLNFYKNENLPKDVKTFDSHETAERFAKRWKGHPWYCKPSGKFEILEIKPVYEQVLKGYEIDI